MKKELKTDLERIAYNCRKATLLIEKKQSIRLTTREKMELRIHLAGCSICRVYEQQSVLINKMMTRLFKGSPRNIKLDSDFKENLQKRIEQKLNDTP
jgi:ribosomal protein S3AE